MAVSTMSSIVTPGGMRDFVDWVDDAVAGGYIRNHHSRVIDSYSFLTTEIKPPTSMIVESYFSNNFKSGERE